MSKEAHRILWLLGQLELLGDLRIGLMYEPVRTPDKFMYLSIEGVEIGGDGILRSVSAHGGSLEECAAALFFKLTELESPDLYIVIDAGKNTRRAVRWHKGLGSWARIPESLTPTRT